MILSYAIYHKIGKNNCVFRVSPAINFSFWHRIGGPLNPRTSKHLALTKQNKDETLDSSWDTSRVVMPFKFMYVSFLICFTHLQLSYYLWYWYCLLWFKIYNLHIETPSYRNTLSQVGTRGLSRLREVTLNFSFCLKMATSSAYMVKVNCRI